MFEKRTSVLEAICFLIIRIMGYGDVTSMILNEAHVGIVGGHYAGKYMVQKILKAILWWPTMHIDAWEYCFNYDIC